MAQLFKLGDEDRERLGAPEWLTLSVVECTLNDITYLSDRFDFELEEWPKVLLGEVPFEFAGSPEAESKRKAPRWGTQAMLWLALHQSGVPSTWEQVGEIKVFKIERRSDDEDGEPGKEEAAPAAPDPTPEPSTTPPSSTSSPD